MHKTADEIAGNVQRLRAEIHKHIVGQEAVIDLSIVALFAGRGSHILFEGVPGIGKTVLGHALATTNDVNFTRIQMTPDLLPGDITGFEVKNPQTGELEFIPGPIFASFLLIDELNRAAPKTKSSLLEAMQEGQVTTIWSGTRLLQEPFMIIATQNPVEQEGTYELGEAEADRFLLKLYVGYPEENEEEGIVDLNIGSSKPSIEKVLNGEDIIAIRAALEDNENPLVYVDDALKKKAIQLVRHTRPAGGRIRRSSGDNSGLAKLLDYVEVGASPRASIAIIRTARVLALLEGREFVTPQDIMNLAYPVLRHRIKFYGNVRKQDRERLVREILPEIFERVFSEGDISWNVRF